MPGQGRLYLKRPVKFNLRAEFLQGQDVGIHSPPPDHIAARRWEFQLAGTPQHRPGEHNRSARELAQVSIQHRAGDVLGVDAHTVIVQRFDFHEFAQKRGTHAANNWRRITGCRSAGRRGAFSSRRFCYR
jgi:hypothetical protein